MDNQSTTPTTPLTPTTNPSAPDQTAMNTSHQAYASSLSEPVQNQQIDPSRINSAPFGGQAAAPVGQMQTAIPMNSVPVTPSIPTMPPTTPVMPTVGMPPSQQTQMAQNQQPESFTLPSQPFMPPPTTPETMPQSSSDLPPSGGSGKLVFILVFILVAIAGVGGYLLFTMYQKSQSTDNPLVSPTPVPTEAVASPTASLEDPAVEELESVSPSDEVDALEEDIEGSDFSTVDEEVSTLEQEL